jgi:hypothetical protein
MSALAARSAVRSRAAGARKTQRALGPVFIAKLARMISRNPAITAATQLRATLLVSQPSNDRTPSKTAHQNTVGITTINSRLAISWVKLAASSVFGGSNFGKTTGTDPVWPAIPPTAPPHGIALVGRRYGIDELSDANPDDAKPDDVKPAGLF